MLIEEIGGCGCHVDSVVCGVSGGVSDIGGSDCNACGAKGKMIMVLLLIEMTVKVIYDMAMLILILVLYVLNYLLFVIFLKQS